MNGSRVYATYRCRAWDESKPFSSAETPARAAYPSKIASQKAILRLVALGFAESWIATA